MKQHDDEFEAIRPPGMSDGDWGFLLCQLGLMQVFLESEIRKTGPIWHYYLNGILRAQVTIDLQKNQPDGPFRLWYKDGDRLWLEGSYSNGSPAEDWRVFHPDGRLLPPPPRLKSPPVRGPFQSHRYH